ncbi:zf-CCHC domain-containing protein [Tanacetum coccineum]|uniref:Zf-CCHC domain-containing protein n=1 Tax=Tanacetum coccineum TaxID=301880 RepID=A0ABQ4X426_9ASTR
MALEGAFFPNAFWSSCHSKLIMVHEGGLESNGCSFKAFGVTFWKPSIFYTRKVLSYLHFRFKAGWDTRIDVGKIFWLARLLFLQTGSLIDESLYRRDLDIPPSSFCPSCNANVESANHIFFECDIATDMWKLFLDGVIFLFFNLLLGILSMIGTSLGMPLKRKNTGMPSIYSEALGFRDNPFVGWSTAVRRPHIDHPTSRYEGQIFETYGKSKDIDLWYIIVYGDYKPTVRNTETGKDETIPYEKLKDDNKKMLSKNYEAKMVLYNALPIKEFNTIITSLKALDESFSSRNHVRKFLRALPTKWRPKVTAIEESKDLSTLLLDELIGKLKSPMKKSLRIRRYPKILKKTYKSMALKAKRDRDDENPCFRIVMMMNKVMAVRDFHEILLEE